MNSTRFRLSTSWHHLFYDKVAVTLALKVECAPAETPPNEIEKPFTKSGVAIALAFVLVLLLTRSLICSPPLLWSSLFHPPCLLVPCSMNRTLSLCVDRATAQWRRRRRRRWSTRTKASARATIAKYKSLTRSLIRSPHRAVVFVVQFPDL